MHNLKPEEFKNFELVRVILSTGEQAMFTHEKLQIPATDKFVNEGAVEVMQCEVGKELMVRQLNIILNYKGEVARIDAM